MEWVKRQDFINQKYTRSYCSTVVSPNLGYQKLDNSIGPEYGATEMLVNR